MQVIVRSQGLIHFQGKCILEFSQNFEPAFRPCNSAALIAIETKYGVDDASCICTFPSHEKPCKLVVFSTQIEY